MRRIKSSLTRLLLTLIVAGVMLGPMGLAVHEVQAGPGWLPAYQVAFTHWGGFRPHAQWDQQVKWLDYIDPEYGFSLKYPADWVVTPRFDKGVGGTVSFSDPNGKIRIEIGTYLVEYPSSTTLEEWTVQYDNVSIQQSPVSMEDVKMDTPKTVWAGQRLALRREGVSPLTDFKYVNIPNGQTVWFIWTNSSDALVYDEMIKSFRFGKNTPQTLQELYGPDFRVFPLKGETENLTTTSNYVTLGSDPSDYRLPFVGTYYVTTGPGCYYTHQGTSSEAIDYGLPSGTAVLASKSGWIASYGWSTIGYGNLLTIGHLSGYVSWYAHLSSFRVNIYAGQAVSTGCLQAYSGNTGNSEGPHLHFEVRLNGQSVWIRTLPTTTWYSESPYAPCQPDGYNDGTATGPSSVCYP